MVSMELKNLNKSNIVENITDNIGDKKKATLAVNLFFKFMAEELKKNHRIELRGFGSFTNRFYRSYQGRNPKTGETIKVQPRVFPFFKSAQSLKDYLNSD